VPAAAVQRNAQEIAQLGGELPPREPLAAGVVLFDTPASQDQVVTVIIPAAQLARLPNRTFVEIRTPTPAPSGWPVAFLGMVVRGPFHEPDGLRGDSPLITTTAAQGAQLFLPPYHGRAEVQVLGEWVEEGGQRLLRVPRFRPLPGSLVTPLPAAEVQRYLGAEGDLHLGRAVSYAGIKVAIPTREKSVLPRHLAIFGSTGSGKSTTVSRLIVEAQRAGMAVVVLDVEGEYCFLHEPTSDPLMVRLLQEQGQRPAGIPAEQMVLYTLVGQEPANPNHPHQQAFTLTFDCFAPGAVAELLDLNEAQTERFLRAYDLAVELLRERSTPQNQPSWDDQERGFPGLPLAAVVDVVRAIARWLEGQRTIRPTWQEWEAWPAKLQATLEHAFREQLPRSPASWRALQGRLSSLLRLGIFDHGAGQPLNPRDFVVPGRVSVVDLSGVEAPEQRNLAIAEVLRTVLTGQEEAGAAAQRNAPPRTLVIIEEAHEFISVERRHQMPVLFSQIVRIARRGRKRWLGLVFVTHSPQHLPSELLGLVNNLVLHRLTDSSVLPALRQAFGAIDEGLWQQLSSLAPGQAIVSFTCFSRPLLVTIDPTPVRLHLAT
jgi:hypothetical protein